jgi:hypothetical protein
MTNRILTAMTLGLMLAASASIGAMAREKAEGKPGHDPELTISQPDNMFWREKAEGPRGRDPEMSIGRPDNSFWREKAEGPRGRDPE